MGKDTSWKEYLSDNSRYADLINGLGCGGRQVITEKDLYEVDTQTGFFTGMDFATGPSGKNKKRKNPKIRDIVRKAAFGMNFAVIGIEHQEEADYELPLRNLSYDAGEYEKQAAIIRNLTFILYTGAAPWDGPRSLHDILDFTDIPIELCKRVPNYEINLIEIRKFEDTSVFRTDVKQVFDFIRNAEDREALKAIVEQDACYKHMEEDAFNVIVRYANAEELIKKKDFHKGEGGRINMCRAIRELIEEGWEKGRKEGKEEGREEGEFETLYDLVCDNMLTMESAASRKNLTVDEFRIKLQELKILQN